MPDNLYPKSQMPPARSTTGFGADKQPAIPGGRTLYDTSRAQQTARAKGPIIVAEDRTVSYPSMVWAEKLVVPRRDSDPRLGNFDEVLARDLGRHIAGRVKEGFRISPAEAAATLGHYTGVVRGLQLFDEKALADFEGMARQFNSNPTEQALMGIENFMNGLVPEARGAE